MIAAEGLSKTFESKRGDRVTALTDINFRIPPGKFVCIVGPSGCGKSTLLRLIGGLEQYEQGRLFLDGKAIRDPSPNVGIMFQSATLLPWYTILSNVTLPLKIGMSHPDAEKRARDLLVMAGLAGFEDKYPYQLSGGMQQRAAICRALARDPQVLLMDEPFGALDALTRERMNIELKRIWQASSKTVVMVTHSIQESILLSDVILVMSARPGRIIEQIEVNFPRPRTFGNTTSLPEYDRLATRIRGLLDDGEPVQH